MQEMIKAAEASLDEALEFFQSEGVRLGYRPRFRYVDRNSVQGSHAIACVVSGASPTLALSEQILGVLKWDWLYGLKVNDKANQEYATLYLERANKTLPRAYQNNEGTIFLLRGFKEKFEKGGKTLCGVYVAHEVWHLRELELGVLQQYPLIAEGTATYAETGFLHRTWNYSGEWPPHSSLSLLLYREAADIVHHNVGEAKHRYLAALDVSVRAQIHDELLQRSISNPGAPEMLSLGDTKGRARYVRQRIPEFQPLKGNLTPKALLEAYRRMGANKLADELQSQDLGRLVKTFRMSGF